MALLRAALDERASLEMRLRYAQKAAQDAMAERDAALALVAHLEREIAIMVDPCSVGEESRSALKTLDDCRADGAADERAVICAWLRRPEHQDGRGAYDIQGGPPEGNELADAIAAGAHREVPDAG